VLIGGWGLGCTSEETGFFVRGNVTIEAPDCIASAEADALLISSGVLDVALRRDYQASLLVASQLAPRGDKGNLRTETMIATITGAEVHLHKDTGELDGNPFTVPANGVIPPNASNDPGFGIATATLIPADRGNELFAELAEPGQIRTRIAEVTVFGKTIGGLDIETAPFSYVIRVCKGCLVDFPAEALSEPDMNGVQACNAPTDQTPESPCRLGQDDPVDCRVCASSSDYCLIPGGLAP
jgi:hypothetical protein